MEENIVIDYEMQEQEEKNMEREKIESNIRGLISQLEAPTSDIGDWKIIKCNEANMLGEELPYDIHELGQKRKEVRLRINELQRRLQTME